jgi:hypothetical protein
MPYSASRSLEVRAGHAQQTVRNEFVPPAYHAVFRYVVSRIAAQGEAMGFYVAELS